MYWPGNAAKMQVTARILEEVQDRDRTLIFDYGCGTGGDWPQVLSDHPQIQLVAYDPDEAAAAEARSRLESFGAQVLSGGAIDRLELSADFIVSFSVFEHVYDRLEYLRTARRLLGPQGLFFLNYDDGHFRVPVDLARPSISWYGSLRVLAHNVVAPVLARAGRIASYQARVQHNDADRLVEQAGFACREDFYSNCTALKHLFRTIPEDRREEYCELWMEFERQLNQRFKQPFPPPEYGDDVNLWRVMASRTLVLEPTSGPA